MIMEEEAKLNLSVAHKGGFAVKFDDMKRRWAREHPDFTVNKLQTCQQGTPEYFMWMGVYTMPENTTVEYTLEEDKKTYTFYTRLKTQHE